MDWKQIYGFWAVIWLTAKLYDGEAGVGNKNPTTNIRKGYKIRVELEAIAYDIIWQFVWWNQSPEWNISPKISSKSGSKISFDKKDQNGTILNCPLSINKTIDEKCFKFALENTGKFNK